MKKTSTKALLFAFVLVLGMIVSPVCAVSPILPNVGLDDEFFDQVYSLDYNATDGLAIAGIQIRVPYDTTLTFTLNPVQGTTETGTLTYTGDFLSSTYTVEIGSDSDSTTMADPLHAAALYHIGVASNGTGDRGYFARYEMWTQYFGPMAYSTIANASPITGLSFTSNHPVNVRIITESYEKAYADLQPGGMGDLLDTYGDVKAWIDYAWEITDFVFNLVVGLFYWLKFFFIDNLIMTVSLYLGISMAYTFCTAKNIFVAFGKFFQDQKKLFDFILSLWRALIEIIASFRGIFRI